jgi:uncharacterized membrane protein YqhA
MDQLLGTFERGLGIGRISVLLPVAVLLLSGIGGFIYGAADFIYSLVKISSSAFPVQEHLSSFLTEVDLFLIGATLIIAAIGLYELFVRRLPSGPSSAAPGWLHVRDLSDLKGRVISMLILVSAVTFVDVVLEFSRYDIQTLYLGASIAVVIVALTIYNRFGSESE